jgi:feruloyl esterase
MIFNASACRFDRSALCQGAKAGLPVNGAGHDLGVRRPGLEGRQVYPGFLFDTGIAVTQGLPGLLHGGQLPGGAGVTTVGMDVDSAVERALADPAESLSTTSRWTNLNTFSSRGGKLIFWHGVSDPWFSALDTVDYYERMAKANGGPEQVRIWSRLFLSPGMGHCGGRVARLLRCLDRNRALGRQGVARTA